MIEFYQVCFGYSAGLDIVRDLSFKVASNEKVCLLGLNGSGKSTLLRLAAGILVPGKGEVLINGISTRDSSRFRELRAAIGFIFQNPDDQIVATTVEREIVFTLENLSSENSKMKLAVADMAERFNLKGLLHRHPASLSGGEKQRLALAGTLVSDPQILFLDEPTSFLDYKGRKFLFDFLGSHQDKTIIAATQFLPEMESFQRVLFLKDGRVEFDGIPSELHGTNLIPPGNSRRENKSGTGAKSTAGAEVSSQQQPEPQFAIKAAGLSFAYGRKSEVLENIDLEIPCGEITAVVGDSGSGKTTLGLLLSRLLAPSSGEIETNVEADAAAEPAIIFQFPESQFFAETVFEEVAFGIQNQGEQDSQKKTRVSEALTRVGLDFDRFADRSPFTLSSGEQRRVAIASTLIMDRPMLIIDEPTAGLDWLGSERILRLLFDLRQSGKTIIVMSHDFDFVCRSAEYIILLDEMKIKWHGSKFSPEFPFNLFREHFGELPSSLRRSVE